MSLLSQINSHCSEMSCHVGCVHLTISCMSLHDYMRGGSLGRIAYADADADAGAL